MRLGGQAEHLDASSRGVLDALLGRLGELKLFVLVAVRKFTHKTVQDAGGG